MALLRYRENGSRGKRLLTESHLRLGTFILLLILSFICLSLWGVRHENPLANGFSFALTPLKSAVSQWGSRGEERLLSWKDLMEARARADELAEENQKLKQALALLEGVESENRRLRRLHGLAEEQPWETLPADVIGRGGEEFRTFLLNRGSISGIAPDQPVITYSGLVGRVMAVQPHACLVLALSDPNSALGAFAAELPDEATGAVVLGVLSGDGAHQLVFEPRGGGDVPAGWPVYTSSSSTIYPAGLLAGWIREPLKGGYALQRRFRVEPAVDFGGLREVLVLVGLHREEAMQLSERGQ